MSSKRVCITDYNYDDTPSSLWVLQWRNFLFPIFLFWFRSNIPKCKLAVCLHFLRGTCFYFSCRNAELAKPVHRLYRGTLRVLLVLLHDFPEFLCDYHYSFCDVIPPNCIQMRNLILSAFPRNMRLPDPFTPNLKVKISHLHDFFHQIIFHDDTPSSLWVFQWRNLLFPKYLFWCTKKKRQTIAKFCKF